MRILIAEDERISRRSIQRQLESWGHEVVATEDGEEAWDQFQQRQFDIVVTDWDMPRVDGRQLIERIRSSDHSGYVYSIMLTGRSEKEDLVAGMEAGADDFLAKPFDRNELRVRLKAGERIIQLERRLASQNQALTKANERMKRDLDAAAMVQRDLLPTELPERLRAMFAWHFEPCDEVGGDTLNVLPLNGSSVAMYLLDVTGHGVPAALLSVTLSRVLTTRDPGSSVLVAQDPGLDDLQVTAPREVAERLNRQFPSAGQGGRFFTLAYAVLDTETGALRYTIAGHPPPILVRPGRQIEQLSGLGFPIGIVDEPGYEEYCVQLEPGDRLFIFSDGITEATNADGRMLDPAGFIRLLAESREQPLSEFLSSAMSALKQWVHPIPFNDDISVLALEYSPP